MLSVLERGKITPHFSFQPNCIPSPAGDAELQGMERRTDPTPSPRSDRSWTPTRISAGTLSLPPRDVSGASHRHITRCKPTSHRAKTSTFCVPTGVFKNLKGSREPGEQFLQQSSAAGAWPRKTWWVKAPPEAAVTLQRVPGARHLCPHRSRSRGAGFASPPGGRQGREAQTGRHRVRDCRGCAGSDDKEQGPQKSVITTEPWELQTRILVLPGQQQAHTGVKRLGTGCFITPLCSEHLNYSTFLKIFKKNREAAFCSCSHQDTSKI